MKATKTKPNPSARKKLVPAVAMLTTSAIMLSTATYAWFTLNKEVEVTGLKMSATAGNSLEISLGALGTSASKEASPTQTAPGVDDISWKSSIAIDDYYASVGKLKPASSDTGTTLFYVSGSGIYNGGKDVDGTTLIAKATAATLVLDDSTGSTFAVSDSADAEGYYIDVPMWLRTNETTEGGTAIECTVTITDGDTPSSTGSAEDLMKAVRVAILPTGSANTSTGIAGLTYTASDTVTLGSADGVKAGTIFGLDSSTYYSKVITSTATAGYAYNNSLTTSNPTVKTAANALIDSTYFDSDDTADNANTTPATTVFTIPAATVNDYAGVAFIARVWIEGESTYCNDATANQDWQIDFHFNIVESE